MISPEQLKEVQSIKTVKTEKKISRLCKYIKEWCQFSRIRFQAKTCLV